MKNELIIYLEQLQDKLLEVGLWQDEPIDEQLLNSDMPFYLDTLSGEQWLQFVFIPKLRELLDNELHQNIKISLKPYFEETFKDHPHKESLLSILANIDALYHD